MVHIIVPSNIMFQGITTKHYRGNKIDQKNGIKHKSSNLLVGKRRISNGNISQNTYTLGPICFRKVG